MRYVIIIIPSLLAAALVGGSAFAADDVAAQIEAGKKLYVKHCATCHGDAGQGGKKAPPVVGKDALPLDPPPGAKFRKTKFHTAADVYDFVKEKMPAKKPGSLKSDEYAAILAFDLTANGVTLEKKVTPEVAKTIVLHP